MLTGLFKDISSFPRLNDLAIQFCEKNGILQPKRMVNTHGGLILDWQEDLVLLSQEIEGDLTDFLGPRIFPNIGGDGMSSEQQVNYALSGILYGKMISLAAEISDTQNYKRETAPGMGSLTQEVPVPVGELKRIIIRRDSESYWFLTEQRPVKT